MTEPHPQPQQMPDLALDEAGDTPKCSARGCRAAARWAVVWNNPKVHTPDREKVWAACDDHRQHLADYVDARKFLKRVEPLAAPAGGPVQ